jgi:hypothetical protein
MSSGLDSAVKTLLHMNGEDASTDFPDSSDSELIWTPSGAAQISTTESVFGDASAYFNKDSDCHIKTPSHEDFNFGSDDFTIDFWLKRDELSVHQVVFGRGDATDTNAGRSFQCWIASNNYMSFRCYVGGSTFTCPNNHIFNNTSTWYHVQLQRVGNWLWSFVDGVLQNNASLSGSVNNVGTFGISKMGDSPTSGTYKGWIDEFRVTKGIARQNESYNFTPKTEEYSVDGGNDSSAVLMLHCDGADESTDFPDDSISEHTATANGAVEVDTDEQKFGTGSLWTDTGTPSDYIEIADSEDWNGGSGDYTWEMWVKRDRQSQLEIFCAQGFDAGGNRSMVMYFDSSTNKVRCNYYLDGGVLKQLEGDTAILTSSGWTHIAFTRWGDTLRL